MAYLLGYMVIGGGVYGLVRLCMNLRNTMMYATYTAGFYVLLLLALAVVFGLVKLLLFVLTIFL